MRLLTIVTAALLLVKLTPCAEWQYAPRPDARLELQLPEGSGPFPLVVAIHGGGWESGSRADTFPFCRIVLAAGFACASPEYRLAPSARLPIQLEDLRLALTFLHDKAADLHLESSRIVLAGESAGGHLAALAALRLGKQFGIKGVAAFSTPFDLEALALPGQSFGIIPTQVGQLLNLSNWSEDGIASLRRASPLVNLAAGSPPFLVIRGADDQLVPASQSAAFCARAASLAIPCSIHQISGARHVLWNETALQQFEPQWHLVFLEWLRGIRKSR